MTVFVCREDPEGIFSGVYEAFMSRLGHENVRLEIENHGNMELFCQYREVEPDEEQAKKVTTAIRAKISEEAYEQVYYAALSQRDERADQIYRFLVAGFHYGPSVLKMYQKKEVSDLFEMYRNVGNERHLLTGFVRFSETSRGILFSRIGPKNDTLILLASHFADRFPEENWIIYDEKRKKALVHPSHRRWILVNQDYDYWADQLGDVDESYENLWKTFRDSVAIKERINPLCQRTHMAYRYRPYMPEFRHGLTEEDNHRSPLSGKQEYDKI